MVYQISISRVRVHGVYYIITIMSEAECPEYRLTDPSLVSLKGITDYQSFHERRVYR